MEHGTTDRRGAICCVGPLPPPAHGMANVQLAMVEALRERGADVRAVGVQSRLQRRGLAYHADKSWRALIAFIHIIGARMGGARSYYGNVDDALGGVWTGSFALLARLLGYRIHLHHHSYRYLVERSGLVSAIARAAGPEAVHIALCGDMAERMRTIYPAMREVIAVPNCVDLPNFRPDLGPDLGPAPAAREGLIIGMLSNLTFEKGVGEFVDIVRRAAASGAPVRGVLAGPAVGEEVERFLADALAEPGLPLEWRGKVAGADKLRFFADIDLFVFPTRYRTEAYPLVLLEALVHGVPIMAPRRGCIGAFAGLASAHVVALEEDFVAAALHWLESAGYTLPQDARSAARKDGESLNTSNSAAREALLDRLVAAQWQG